MRALTPRAPRTWMGTLWHWRVEAREAWGPPCGVEESRRGRGGHMRVGESNMIRIFISNISIDDVTIMYLAKNFRPGDGPKWPSV